MALWKKIYRNLLNYSIKIRNGDMENFFGENGKSFEGFWENGKWHGDGLTYIIKWEKW